MPEERRLRGSKAVAASALLHLACLALLLRGVSDRPLSERPPPIPAVEITLAEAPPEVAAPPAAPPPAAPSTARRPRTTPVAEPPAPGGPIVPPRPPAEAKAAEAEPPSRAGPPIDLSLNGLGDGAKRRAAAVPDPAQAEEPPLVPPPDPPHGRLSPSEIRADAERRADAVENVRAGRAHPLLFDYLRNARDLLTPEATRIAESLPLGPAASIRGWGRGYLGRVAAVNRHAATDLPEEPDPTLGGRRPDVLGAYNEAGRQAASGGEERTAQICLGVAPDRDVVVTLRRSSGNAALDKLAISSFESAARVRPVAADIRPGLACYLVRVSAFRMPPLPSLSLGWKNSHPDVIYPLKRITKVTVELESVDFGARRGPSSLLRAP